MPPANIAAIARCRGACCLSCPVGRAISPAEPIIFLIFIMCGVYGRVSRNPRMTMYPCREAYMPPLQTPGIASMIPGTGGSGRFTGRMHAAPTNRPKRGCLRGKRQVSGRFACLRTRAGFQNGSPDEPFRQERKGIVTESRCLARNANRLGRPPQSPGVSKGARASELAAAFSVFAAGKTNAERWFRNGGPGTGAMNRGRNRIAADKGRHPASEKTESCRAEPGFATLPKNGTIGQTGAAGSRPRPTG